ncbi:MAG: response regulator [Chloroflexi bacterium]|nr:response regulator [Chloroflexota bacterium]
MKGNVMVVDDDIEIRQLLCTMLRMMGYQTLEAINGEDALEKLQEQIPDAMILDVMMPKMDGITLCKTIRQDDIATNLPIIMLSGKAQQEDIDAGLNAGANRYLPKPMAMDVLLQSLDDLMVVVT